MRNYFSKRVICLLLIGSLFIAASAGYLDKFRDYDYESLEKEYNKKSNEGLDMPDSLLFYTAELSTDLVRSLTLYTQITNKYASSPFYLPSLLRLAKYYYMTNDTLKCYDMTKKLIYADNARYSTLGYMIMIGHYERMGDFENTKKYIAEFTEKFPGFWFLSNYEQSNKEHTITMSVYYGVQIGAFSSKDNAAQLVSEFKEKGYSDTHIVKKDQLYKVLIGKFEQYADALSYSTVLQKSEGISVWVIKVE